MLRPFTFSMRTKVYFGVGCVSEALGRERSLVGPRPLLVTTGGALARLGYVDELSHWLGPDTLVFDGVSADPDVREVMQAVELGRAQAITSVVGFGGGSAMDAAKAVSVCLATGHAVEDYLLGATPLPQEALPIIAIPTTAGTGAELSRGAIISCRERRMKGGIRGDAVVPALALVDPRYTYTVSRVVTLETGFDVFAHAAESYCSRCVTPVSEMLSEKAVRIVGRALPRLARDLGDREARDELCLAAHLMGNNVRDVGNCLPHRMQYPLGAHTHTSHGAGLIALYPAWLEAEEHVAKDRVSRILAWLECPQANTAGERIRAWLQDMGMDRRLGDLGCSVGPGELACEVTGNLAADPLASSEDIVCELYRASW